MAPALNLFGPQAESIEYTLLEEALESIIQFDSFEKIINQKFVIWTSF